MFQLKYQDEFLDIASSSDAEIERKSPLFLIDDILAEYSTPISILYTDKNSRLLGQIFFELTAQARKKITVDVYDFGTYRSSATLVLESAGYNSHYYESSNAGGYVLFGISYFFSQLQKKKLTDLILGGARVLNYTTDDATDMSDGYWQKFEASWDFNDDYVVAPVRNLANVSDDWEFTNCDSWMNKISGEHLVVNQPIYPFPKLEYVLTKIFEEAGWKLDTSEMTDTQWKRLILFTNYFVSTSYYNDSGGGVIASTHKTSVTINLALAMPAEKYCSSFIFELCKKYFWALVPDYASNTCRLIALKDMRNKVAKDWTRYAVPGSAVTIDVDEKIFAFKNTFEGEDDYPSSLDLTPWPYHGFRVSRNLLPALDETQDNTLYYTYLENKFYKTETTTGAREWVEEGDQIYDVAPDNATDTFETLVTTLPMIKKQIGVGWGLFPICNQAKFTPWGIKTLIWHGMVPQVDEDDVPLGVDYPYASSLLNTPDNMTKLDWSNVLQHTDFFHEYGIIEYWAKDWTKMIAPVGTIERAFNLPLHELVNFRFDDKIAVHNIEYLVKSFRAPLSYRGTIVATLQRLALFTKPVVAVEPPPEDEVYFNGYADVASTSTLYNVNQFAKGPAGAVVTCEIIEIIKSNIDFYVKINNSLMFVGYTFTITLDGSGNGYCNVKFGGVTAHGNAILMRMQITGTDTGTIGSPDIAQHSKIIA